MTSNKFAFILIAALLAFFPWLAKADLLMPQNFQAASSGFVFKNNDQVFSVPPQTAAAWHGLTEISDELPVAMHPLSPMVLLQTYLGIPANKQKNIRYIHFRPEAVYNYLQSLALQIGHPAQEPQLQVEGATALAFTPPQDGAAMDVHGSTLRALAALENGQASIELIINDTKPRHTLGELNTLGIRELVGHGISKFNGSPNNRRHNIEVGVEKMKGVIVAPGDTFSFNKYLGEVDGQHGFLPELVIKKEGTIPEFGGGLCQVSSTTFRAAMDAGLPIKERRNHAYAVQYYSPQGTDATIYPGVVDLKFVNDTPAYLLIWPYFTDKNTLVFDFYGTKDDRQVTIEKPVQFDRKPDGSMKATWTRLVIKNGETSTSTFKSVYQSPALFHKAEQFVSSTTPVAITSTH